MGKPILLSEPEFCPGAYTLDAYCKYKFDEHACGEFPHSFIGETRGECVRQAKRAGWKIHRDRTATCPKCAKALSA